MLKGKTSKFMKINGGPAQTRTGDLYRVKVAQPIRLHSPPLKTDHLLTCKIAR